MVILLIPVIQSVDDFYIRKSELKIILTVLHNGEICGFKISIYNDQVLEAIRNNIEAYLIYFNTCLFLLKLNNISIESRFDSEKLRDFIIEETLKVANNLDFLYEISYLLNNK